VPLLGVAVMVSVYYLLIRYVERRNFSDFDTTFALKNTSIGLVLGFLIISVAVALMYVLGYYEVLEVNDLYSFLPSATLILGVVVLEELVFRGLIFTIIEKWKGTTVALFASSILFQLPHFMNPHEDILPATLGVLFGMATAYMYIDTRTLWLPIAFHFSWNIAQPILGTTLSGISEFDAVLITQIDGPELITGSAFGVEDSLVAMLSLIAIIAYYHIKIKQKDK
ncbi:CPBP family intramembrane metalloprotease, partial [Fulvivirga sp. RKSG066]|uniref:CPBP family intramembrane glutamic endopeptidase n=1 Tax=Fulvivirga aurantia TaxID=2529383 RepID=UPI0012BCA819